jgi:hypothetical protein
MENSGRQTERLLLARDRLRRDPDLCAAAVDRLPKN